MTKNGMRKPSTEQKMFFLVLLNIVPVLVLLPFVLFTNDLSWISKIVIDSLCSGWTIAIAFAAKQKLEYHLRTVSNFIEAIRSEDLSLRSSRVRESGTLSELYKQIAALTNDLQESRRQEVELGNLLEKIVDQMDVAVVAFDPGDKITLVNKLAIQLFDVSLEKLLGMALEQTPIADLLDRQGSILVEHSFAGASGRWRIQLQSYRYQGKPAKIVFITDLQQILGEEEIAAWQRLIRVISHEINNSLTPIVSICQTLDKSLASLQLTSSDIDLREGLSVIEGRAKGLRDFISDYARIAKLPEPQKVTFGVNVLLNIVSQYFLVHPVVFRPYDSETLLFGDPALLEQLLINLITNAVEASSEDMRVIVSCRMRGDVLDIEVKDNGIGISNPTNLFVPFYTTKAKGTGIGLTLCRQIAAKHGGQVHLENRQDSKGAVARLTLPVVN
jgi:two-component system nitrogen regulation sensor histidine kinase NtrY